MIPMEMVLYRAKRDDNDYCIEGNVTIDTG